jgi:hypothetical protein
VGNQRRFIAGCAPFPVMSRRLSDHSWTQMIRKRIQFFLDLSFKDRALLFDHNQFLQPRSEIAQTGGLERPDHPHPKQAQTHPLRGLALELEQSEGFNRIEISLAAGRDTDACIGARPGHLVDRIGSRVSDGSRKLVLVEPLFLSKRSIWPTDIESTGRQRSIDRGIGPHARPADTVTCRVS